MDEARNTGNTDVQKKAGFGFDTKNLCRVDNGGCWEDSCRLFLNWPSK